jgi:hypothetical protein
MTPGTRMWSEQPYLNPVGRAVVTEPATGGTPPSRHAYGGKYGTVSASAPADGWRSYDNSLRITGYAAKFLLGPQDVILVASYTRGIDEVWDDRYFQQIHSSTHHEEIRFRVWVGTGVPAGNQAHYAQHLRMHWTAGASSKYWNYGYAATFFRGMRGGRWEVRDVVGSALGTLAYTLTQPPANAGGFSAQCLAGGGGSISFDNGWLEPWPSFWDNAGGLVSTQTANRTSATEVTLTPCGISTIDADSGAMEQGGFQPGAHRNVGTFTGRPDSLLATPHGIGATILWRP